MKTNDLNQVLNSDVDPRRMCFEQGKVFVYMPREAGDVIIMEDPNGVVKYRRISDGMVTRTGPDGRVDRFRRDDPEDIESVHYANHQVVPDVERLTIAIGAIDAARALGPSAIFEHCLWISTTLTLTTSPKVWRVRT